MSCDVKFSLFVRETRLCVVVVTIGFIEDVTVVTASIAKPSVSQITEATDVRNNSVLGAAMVSASDRGPADWIKRIEAAWSHTSLQQLVS